MKILKFWKTKAGKIILGTDGARMVDMSDDPRSGLIPKALFASDEYKVDDGVHFVRQGFFIKLANIKGLTTSIEALYCTYEGKHIIIVNSRTYVFFNGKPVEPTEYKLLDLPNLSEVNEKLDAIEKKN
jgi:hypothetical protein